MCIKIKELEPSFDIFSIIDKLKPHTQQYTETGERAGLNIFYMMDAETWDLLYRNRYGSRICSSILLENTREDIAIMIFGAFHEKWNNALTSLHSYNRKGITTKLETMTPRNNTNTITTINEVSGYENNDLVTDTKNTTTSTTTEDGYTKQITLQDDSSMKYNELESMLDNNIIIDTVFNDVNSLLTLQIFESEVI